MTMGARRKSSPFSPRREQAVNLQIPAILAIRGRESASTLAFRNRRRLVFSFSPKHQKGGQPLGASLPAVATNRKKKPIAVRTPRTYGESTMAKRSPVAPCGLSGSDGRTGACRPDARGAFLSRRAHRGSTLELPLRPERLEVRDRRLVEADVHCLCGAVRTTACRAWCSCARRTSTTRSSSSRPRRSTPNRASWGVRFDLVASFERIPPEMPV